LGKRQKGRKKLEMQRSTSVDGAMSAMRRQSDISKVYEYELDQESRILHDDDVDDTMSELEERVRKWLQESCPPASTTTSIGKKFRPEKNKRKEKIQEKRRHSMSELSETRGPNCSTLTERPKPMTLYHPDFADWASCEIKHDTAACIQRSSSPILLSVLDEAHSSLSKFFKFDP
jgi:hypothetical protein